ncbi:DUF1707 domain-containing protein [Williamsia sp.]|uniref:DUF1707 SHOCT-like domain-containing protein n=1 Tax=Williamsia sp. TaxID=1872085 RepID=UPI002F93DCEE
MADEHSDDHIRVGNPERERAITLLNDAFSNGYLEIAEFEERSQVVYASKTRGELRTVLEHLPVAGRLFADVPGVVAHTPEAGSVAAVAPLQLDATWETIRRKGVWKVPPSIVVTGSVGTIDLDFTNATFLAPSIEVELQVSASTVKIRIGADHEIRYSDLDETGWSGLKDKCGQPSRPGGPLISLTGSISAMSGVKLRRA